MEIRIFTTQPTSSTPLKTSKRFENHSAFSATHPSLAFRRCKIANRRRYNQSLPPDVVFASLLKSADIDNIQSSFINAILGTVMQRNNLSRSADGCYGFLYFKSLGEYTPFKPLISSIQLSYLT